MKSIHPGIPSFSKFKQEIELYGLKVLKVAAAANLVFHAYHLKKSQALLNTGYFVGLHLTEDAALKGITSDNIAETHSLARAVHGNLEESSSVLKSLNELVHGRKEEARGLKGEVNRLKGAVSDLESTRKALEAATQRLIRVGDYLEQTTKNLDQKIAQLTELRQEIEKAKAGEINA